MVEWCLRPRDVTANCSAVHSQAISLKKDRGQCFLNMLSAPISWQKLDVIFKMTVEQRSRLRAQRCDEASRMKCNLLPVDTMHYLVDNNHLDVAGADRTSE